MNKEKKIVVPGEEIGTTEEFLAGEGTFELKGSIISSYFGELNLDSEEMVAKVKPINPLVRLKVGDVVLAHVQDVKSSMIMVNVIRVEGNPRGVTGETSASIHVSRISEGYTSDVWKEFRIGDIIRARVMQTKPSLQLSTDKPSLGVLLGFCTRCRMPLEKKDKTLFCENCKRNELRKTAPDYGGYQFRRYR
ncbi:MAG: exosome complex RNA-binding protein Csl4 [Methanomassiliicoccales archaeon]|nr:MAG: exosome complex RNA-binding protein Csl4 [Methanomassiliicoccales archaeon]